MPVTVRPIEPDEKDRWLQACGVPFLNVMDDDEADHWRPFLEDDRTWAAVDRDAFVGTCCVFTRDVTVPGGGQSPTESGPHPTVPMTAISGVGVYPTHRRQGVLRRMMGGMLADGLRRGELLAGLRASETAIYGRYGFGCASQSVAVEIDANLTRLDPAVPAPQLRLHLVAAEEAPKALPGLFERLRRLRPGQVDRTEAYWADVAADRPGRRRGASGRFIAVGDDGYVTWRVREDAGGHRGRLVVEDLVGATPDIEAGLWQFVLDIDLVDEIEAPNRPVDEPLPWRLVDRRDYQTTALYDFLWVRVLDVPATLAARGYRSDDRLVLEVHPAAAPVKPDGSDGPDPAAGRWVLDAGTDGASCRPARPDDGTDIQLGAADLGAIVLGGAVPSVLAGAHRISEVRPGALERADALFVARPAPFSLTGF